MKRPLQNIFVYNFEDTSLIYKTKYKWIIFKMYIY